MSELTLADEFLADLGDLDALEDGGDDDAKGNIGFDNNIDDGDDDGDGDDDDSDNDDDDARDELAKHFGGASSSSTARLKYDNIGQVVKLWRSEPFSKHMAKVDAFAAQDASATVARAGEYELIVESNSIMFAIDNEIDAVYKFCRDLYSSKFPELESLVLNAMDYVRVVKAIGNEVDLTQIDLTELLPANTIMVVSVTATTSRGSPLDAATLAKVIEACDVALGLDQAKARILAFVQSRMSAVAPNLSALVGSQVAAKLMAAAGGLAALSKMPANVVMALGTKKQDRAGMSSASTTKNGFINESPLMLKTPPDLRVRAARAIGGRCALAARIDAYQNDSSGATGRAYFEEIDGKINKWQEAPPGSKVKALPAPVMDRKSRRAGKRARRRKEMFAYSEMRQAANRVAFGQEQDTFGLEENELGMLGSSASSGKVRIKADKRVSKMVVKAQKVHQGGGGSGFASVAFTPVQGLELENPNAAAERAAKSEKVGYFDVAASFKKPDLPPTKRPKIEKVEKTTSE